ncbi:paraneoplastic antigen Ma3 homolog [Diretmus argenteus]
MPGDVQKVIVEHIVKHESAGYTPSTRELRPYSGNSPKPPSEVDYSIWRLRVKQWLNDSTLSEGQQRRMLLDSLLSPALSVALSIGPQAPLSAYLQELDKAYGNVTGGEELYIQFLETYQDQLGGERASDYLRRLQTLIQEVVESNGVTKKDADSQLLKQFLRGCWDNCLISTLHLKEQLKDPMKSTPSFSELLFNIRTYEKENQLKENRRKRHMGGNSARVHSKTLLTTEEPEPSSHSAPSHFDAHAREQLEERIRQLEAELWKNAPARNTVPFRNDKGGWRPAQKTKSSSADPPIPALPTGNQTKDRQKFGTFCYNCGEDSHMMPQCNNQTNAVLVQKKLCERHHARQSERALGRQQSGQPNLSLND